MGQDDAPNAWHNLGSMGFDGDGYLWALVGEKNDRNQAQNAANTLGSVIRIDPIRDPDQGGYRTVADNPFADVTMYDANIVAYGLRSPWRGHSDAKGNLWIGDVGGEVEEVNVLRQLDGTNFGWPVQDGTCTMAECAHFKEPLLTWNRAPDHPFLLEDFDSAPTTRRAVWVGLAYRGGHTDRYRGRFTDKLVYGDFCAGWVRAAAIDDAGELIYDNLAGHLEGVTSGIRPLTDLPTSRPTEAARRFPTARVRSFGPSSPSEWRRG